MKRVSQCCIFSQAQIARASRQRVEALELPRPRKAVPSFCQQVCERAYSWPHRMQEFKSGWPHFARKSLYHQIVARCKSSRSKLLLNSPLNIASQLPQSGESAGESPLLQCSKVCHRTEGNAEINACTVFPRLPCATEARRSTQRLFFAAVSILRQYNCSCEFSRILLPC